MQKPALMPTPKINFNRLKSEIHIPRFNRKNLFYLVMTFVLSTSKVMGNLTPFGTAFFVSVCDAKNLIPSLAGLAVGSIIAHPSAMALCYVISAAVMAMVRILTDKPIKTAAKATAAGTIVFFAKTVASAKGGLLVYDMLINFVEGVVCALATVAADKAVPVLFSVKRRKCLSCEETVSVVVILAALTSAFNNIPALFGIKIGNILGISMILLLNMYAPVPTGAVVGIVVGTINSMGTYNSGNIIGAYAFSSLVSALFQRYGKTGVMLSFILANASITVFLNGSTEVLINIYEIFIASVLTLAVPKSTAELFVHMAGISTAEVCDYSKSGEENLYRKRLSRTARSLDILSRKCITQTPEDASKKELTALVAGTARRACADCSLRHCCWQKKGGETKKSILQMMSAASSHGRAYTNDLDDALKNRCIRAESLVRAFNDAFEVYRTNLMWHKRLYDCKALSVSQLGSIAKIMENLAEDTRTYADSITYEQIQTALDGAGISPSHITAYFKEDGNLIIELEFAKSAYTEDIKFKIAPCLSQIIGVKIRFNEMYNEMDSVYLNYSMCERFCRATGAACMKKDGEKVCGDSFVTVNLTNGTYVSAISDGMGSGESAARESKNTIDLLKNFLHCGFDVMHAVRLINSSLIMTGNEEIFATMDLCSVNMHTGKADFIKIGGATTYIKTGTNVEKISASSLPAGILEDIRPRHISKQLEKDTVILMVSDGIENASADDKWLEKRLRTIEAVNPHIIADKILELALFNSGGKAKDDMTVIATRIWEEKNV